MEEKVKLKKITIVVNIFTPLVYFIMFTMNEFTLLPVCILGNYCSTNDFYDKINLCLFKILFVNLIVSIILNINNKIGIQIKLFFKQLLMSILICFEFLLLSCSLLALPVKYFCKVENVDESKSYLIKYQLSGSNADVGIYKGNTGLSFEPLSDILTVKPFGQDIEISWIDNESFNFVLVNYYDENEKYYCSFSSPNKLESITKSEYESCKYVKKESHSTK